MLIKYRPDIDGLRAIAVLSVFVFHYFPQVMPGGFIGVDVFFVISGYLITSIIIKEIDNGNFSFKKFYVKRIIRIFPALFILLFAIYTLGWFMFLQGDFKSLAKHIFGGAFFLSNILLWRETGYFDISATYKPLLHLWSLGIEEQFYLLWPIILTLFARTKRSLYVTGTVFFIASLAFSIYTMHSATGSNYYSPFSRAWELMFGAMIASQGEKKTAKNKMSHKIISTVGFIFLICGFFTINSSMPFPGIVALLPVLGTGMVIYGEKSGFNKILTWKPLLSIGLISYPLYMVHWSFYSGTRIILGHEPSTTLKIVLMTSCLVVAYLIYKYIETPLRKSAQKTLISIILLFSTFFMGIIGFVTYCFDGISSRSVNNATHDYQTFTSITDPYDYFHFQKSIRKDVCHTVEPDIAVKNGCISKNRNQIFIWGDSYSASLYPGIKYVIEKEGYQANISQSTDGNGPPFFVKGRRTDSGKDLLKANNDRLSFVQMVQPKVVVIAWMAHGTNGSSDMPWTIKQLHITISSIKHVSPNSRIVIFGPFPEWNEGLIRQIIHYYDANKTLPPEYMKNGLLYDIFSFDRIIKEAMINENVDYISSVESLCNTEGCLVRTAPGAINITTMDWGHLSEAGSKYLIEKNKRIVFDGLR
ncbi:MULTISPECIES: acyltransferase family protein [Kosakonia]|uniref:acyltransferase family protein n=1 Tax=Kosakonia TaxID=1330547 RepID=UPI0005EFEAB7|nr:MULTISPECIES: acyltransferase family protein [Kosakonia]RCX01729.1 peptidoglycan/LPS O-acetylase OafA/YrhL [Kosakonia sp. AG348]